MLKIDIYKTMMYDVTSLFYWVQTLNPEPKTMDIRKYFKPQTLGPRIFKLDDECWIEQGFIPSSITYDFDALWLLHPEEYGKVRYMGRTMNTPRWQQTYLRNYTFSGMNHEALPLPNVLEPFLAFANHMIEGFNNGQWAFNQVLVNWYINGHHYIGPHSDSEIQLVEDSPVLSISLGQERIFRVKKIGDNNEKAIDIPMPDKSYIVMAGKMQKKYLHEVPKVNGIKGSDMKRRINITFRVFK